MKVLFPTPGTPLTPTRAAPPVCGSSSSRRRCASRWWSACVLSTSVIAFASARRSPVRTLAARVSVALRAEGGITPLDELEHATRRLGHLGAGPEDRLHARALEERPVARRDDATDGDYDVAGAEALELLHELGDERLVDAGLGGHTDHVHVVLDRLARDLLGRLEERADVDVEAEVGERRRDDLRAPVVAVLPDLGDQDARTPPVARGEGFDLAPQRRPLLVLGEVAAVDAGDGTDLSMIAPPDLLERRGDLADRRACADGVDRQREEVPLPALRRARERVQRRRDAHRVARRAHASEARDLRLADGRVVD